MSFSLVTLVATRLLTDNVTPASGFMRFTLTGEMYQSPSGPGFPSAPRTVALDGTGSISIPVVANNDPNTLPTGTAYQVDEIIGDDIFTYYVIVPYTSGGATINLDDLPRASTSPIFYAGAYDAGFEANVRANTLDQMGIPQGNVNMNGYALVNNSSPGAQLAAASWEPTTFASVAASTSVVAVGNGLSCTFQAPQSGSVLVMLEGWGEIAATDTLGWSVVTHGSTALPAGASWVQVLLGPSGAVAQGRAEAKIHVPGLTPGAYYTWDWAHITSAGAGNLYAGIYSAFSAYAVGGAFMRILGF